MAGLGLWLLGGERVPAWLGTFSEVGVWTSWLLGDTGTMLASISLLRAAFWGGLSGFHAKMCHTLLFSVVPAVFMAERQLGETRGHQDLTGTGWEPAKLEVSGTGSAAGASAVRPWWPRESWEHHDAGFGSRHRHTGTACPKPIRSSTALP